MKPYRLKSGTGVVPVDSVLNSTGGHPHRTAKPTVPIGVSPVGDPENYIPDSTGTSGVAFHPRDDKNDTYVPDTAKHQVPYRGAEPHGVHWEESKRHSPDDDTDLPDGIDHDSDNEPQPLHEPDYPPVKVCVPEVVRVKRVRPAMGKTMVYPIGGSGAGQTNPQRGIPANGQRRNVLVANTGNVDVFMGFSESDANPITGYRMTPKSYAPAGYTSVATSHFSETAAPGATTPLVTFTGLTVGAIYDLDWTFVLTGTVGAADHNNLLVWNGTTSLENSANQGTVGTYPQIKLRLAGPAGGSISINTIGAATAGSIYTVNAVLTPVAYGTTDADPILLETTGDVWFYVSDPVNAPGQISYIEQEYVDER